MKAEAGVINSNIYMKRISLITILIAITVRLILLGGDVDIPDWRQADTGYMALRMMNEWPPEMLHPKAPYRGQNDVKAAEYPIYPLTVSLVYRAVGHESLPAARLVTLLFFIGSMVYLGLAAGRLWGRDIGWLTAAVYAILPLGIPYSRMIHPDFCVMFFANAFFYYSVRLLLDRTYVDYALAVLFCSGLFLMKAPYGVYYGFPLGLLALHGDVRKSVRDLFLLASIFVIPLGLGLWFNEYRIAQEASFEESLTYPMKWTKESLNARFFGTVAQRFDGDAWMWTIKRAVVLVSTVPGALLAVAGLFLAGIGWRDQRRWLIWFLAAGVLVYVLLVFPMVTSDHDYYSIPLLALVAVLIAISLERLARLPYGMWWVIASIAAISVGSFYGLQRGPFLYSAPYFTRDWQRLETSRVIRENTESADLVLSVMVGRSTGWSDPRVLWRADRCGWAIEGQYLSPQHLDTYKKAGANVAAVLIAPGRNDLSDEVPSLANHTQRSVHAIHNPDGTWIGDVTLIRLD